MINPLIEQLLEQRGISESDRNNFLEPDFLRDLHPASEMKGMAEAVGRIQQAIKEDQKIAVFGDYDADGVPATALVVRAFQKIGIKIHPFIPSREAGYGLTMEVVEELIKNHIQLLVTVDNGTVSKTEIAALKKQGIDTIICDHHEPQDGHRAEAAIAILNPKQKDDKYQFKELCGCALAWKLMSEVYKAEGHDTQQLKWLLDLVALSTIADMVPLVGENRVLAIYGLKVMGKTRNLGIQALAEVSEVELQDVSAGSIGYSIAPRINAPSRMHQDSEDGIHCALQLLITEDKQEARQLAEILNIRNQERQDLLNQHLLEAESKVQSYLDDGCLVVYGTEWSTGVIGLVAGRLAEKYKRPVIAMAKEVEIIKGSVRSVEGVHAVEMLAAAEDLIEKFGGHAKAAGLSLHPTTDVENFRIQINNWIKKNGWSLDKLEKAAQRKADMDLDLEKLDLNLMQELEELEPFGIGFPRPLFKTESTLSAIKKVGKSGQHMSCFLNQGKVQKKAIAFGMADLPVQEGEMYTVFYSPSINEWNGIKSVSCQIQRFEKVAIV